MRDESNSIRSRTKEYFPTVLLTLLSIVQAIALELLWGKIVSSESLFELSLVAVVGWLQVCSSLFGIMLIWVVYAGNVMRFRWVPNIADSVYPFLVGILEFWIMESIGNGKLGIWFLAFGATFGLMTWVSQITMRKSRFDSDNQQFFKNVAPATLIDFLPQIATVLLLAVGGIILMIYDIPQWLKALLLLAMLMFLSQQCWSTSKYWESSVSDSPSTNEMNIE